MKVGPCVEARQACQVTNQSATFQTGTDRLRCLSKLDVALAAASPEQCEAVRLKTGESRGYRNCFPRHRLPPGMVRNRRCRLPERRQPGPYAQGLASRCASRPRMEEKSAPHAGLRQF